MFAEPFSDASHPATDTACIPQRYVPCRDPDASLKQQIENHLAGHPHFRGRNNCIRFRVRGGVVRVEGCLPSWYLKQLLQEAVGRIPGVKRISNHASVRDWSQVCEPGEDSRNCHQRNAAPHFRFRPEFGQHRHPK